MDCRFDSQTANSKKKTTVGNTVVTQASPDYYGEGKPVTIWQRIGRLRIRRSRFRQPRSFRRT